MIKFIRRAKKELVVIDAYPGVVALDMLAKRGRGVKVELVTHSNGELAESDFEAFGKQCGTFTKTICGICHDRFIIVDGKEVFWKMRRRNALCVSEGRFGESRTRRAHKRPRCIAQGRRPSHLRCCEDGRRIIPCLLASIRKATTERREYGKGKPPRSIKWYNTRQGGK